MKVKCVEAHLGYHVSRGRTCESAATSGTACALCLAVDDATATITGATVALLRCAKRICVNVDR
jgi:hypothetical protein